MVKCLMASESEGPATSLAGRSNRMTKFGQKIRAAIAALGLTQAEAAKRLRVSPKTLEGWIAENARRQPTHLARVGALHVLRFEAAVAWTPDRLARLGNEPDAAIAREMGIKSAAVKRKRWELGIQVFAPSVWTPEAVAMLGTMSDVQVGKLIGVCQQTVLNKRRALGIPRVESKFRRDDIWNDQTIPLLGTMTDVALAAQLGVSNIAVRNRRIALGIPTGQRRKRNP